MDRAARALGGNDASRALFDLARRTGAPTSLREIGMPRDGLNRAADLAIANPYWNPRPFTRDDIRALLDNAWQGLPPRH
jgi:maleylacetate reductase